MAHITTVKDLINLLRDNAESVKGYKSFMFLYTHALSDDIYDLCLLIYKLYISRADELEATGAININNEFMKNNVLQGKFYMHINNFSIESIRGNNISDKAMEEFKKITAKLIGNSNIQIIEGILEKIDEYLKNKMKESALACSFQEIKDYCQDIKQEDIESKSDKILEYEDLRYFSQEILDQQIKDNQIADITREQFFKKYPDLENGLDDYGLIDLSFENYELLKRYNLDGMYYKDYFIYFDDLFWFQDIRRSFLDTFLYLSTKLKGKTRFKIKLNFDKIISLKKYKHVMLIEGAFFGPPYNPEKLFITKNEALPPNIKVRENQKFSEIFGNNITKTEFLFDSKNNSFLIEEVGRNENKGIYLNRLIHSEFDTTKKNIKHFDGSILFYDINTYKQREDTDISKKTKTNKDKKKLFQIDLDLSLQDWENLLLGYYNQNEMVLEYLDEESYKEHYKDFLN